MTALGPVLAAASPAPTTVTPTTTAVSPTSTTVTPGFGPTQGTGDVGASAGLYAFLIVAGLIAVSVVIFISMNRSLRRARHNLGGSVLPRREADQLPVAGLDEPARRDPDDGGAPDGG